MVEIFQTRCTENIWLQQRRSLVADIILYKWAISCFMQHPIGYIYACVMHNINITLPQIVHNVGLSVNSISFSSWSPKYNPQPFPHVLHSPKMYDRHTVPTDRPPHFSSLYLIPFKSCRLNKSVKNVDRL